MNVYNLAAIQRTSRLLHHLCSLLIVLVPMACAVYWATFNQVDWPPPEPLEGWVVGKPYAPGVLLTGFVITLIPAAVVMFGLVQLRRLFNLYGQAKIFTLENCACLQRLSYLLLAWPLIGMVFDALLSVGITINNPPGQRVLSVGLHTDDITLLALGAVFLVIARVMTVGVEMAEEQAQIV